VAGAERDGADGVREEERRAGGRGKRAGGWRREQDDGRCVPARKRRRRAAGCAVEIEAAVGEAGDGARRKRGGWLAAALCLR
jgi:hypothetical protein